MNKWFADAFATIVALIHAIFWIVFLIGFGSWLQSDKAVIGHGMFSPLIVLGVAFVGYVIVVGAISTFIAMNERLADLEKLQEETNRILSRIALANGPLIQYHETAEDIDHPEQFGPANR